MTNKIMWSAEVREAQARLAKIDAAEWPEAYERASNALRAAISRQADTKAAKAAERKARK